MSKNYRVQGYKSAFGKIHDQADRIMSLDKLIAHFSATSHRFNQYGDVIITFDTRDTGHNDATGEYYPTETVPFQEVVQEHICSKCGSAESDGAMFTTIQGSGICDDCI